MKYNFQIQFKREHAFMPIHTLQFESEDSEIVHRFAERYKELDVVLFLKEFLSLFPHESKTNALIEELSQLGDDQWREKIKDLLSENSDLKMANRNLQYQVSELSESRTKKEVLQLQTQITQLRRDLENAKYHNNQLTRDLSDERVRSNQARQNDIDYQNFCRRWRELFPQFSKLEDLANNISSLLEENKKLKKSKQDLQKRFEEIEQEHQKAQQKLLLATNRLHNLNVNPNLAGGGSRSDQLKNEFSQLKIGLFYEASTKVLNGWREQGSQLTFRSEEFSKIKSILSERVFCGGIAYFAKNRGEIDAELHLIMEILSGIEDFSPTPAIFQKIQEKIQAGLLRSKGVDNSDQALIKYANEATDLIDRDLERIANFKTTGEALNEILKFAESGLRLVRDIVNDPNSGELFMPENGAAFDESSHETRDEHKGQIKMTICAGYRVAGNVLVKADVITYEPESQSKKKELNSLASSDSSASSDSQNPKEESEQQNSESIGDETTKNEDYGDSKELLSQEVLLSESNPLQENQDLAEQQKSLISRAITFKGKVTCHTGLNLRSCPRKDSATGSKVAYAAELNFEGWIIGDTWDETQKESDSRWYKLAGQDYWLPACYIGGEPPSDLPPMTIEGGGDESK